MVSLRNAVRENDGFRQIVLLLVFASCVALWLDISPGELAPILVIPLFLGIGETVVDAYDLPRGVTGIPIGLLLIIAPLFVSLIETNTITSSVLTLYTITGLLGMWFVFDGIQQYRYWTRGEQSGSIERFLTDDRNEMMLRFQVSGTVAHAVRDEPRTVSELAEDLDLTESRVERALSMLIEQDMIYRTDDTYHASEYMTDTLSPVKRFVRWVPRRLARPFRMEQRVS